MIWYGLLCGLLFGLLVCYDVAGRLKWWEIICYTMLPCQGWYGAKLAVASCCQDAAARPDDAFFGQAKWI